MNLSDLSTWNTPPGACLTLTSQNVTPLRVFTCFQLSGRESRKHSIAGFPFGGLKLKIFKDNSRSLCWLCGISANITIQCGRGDDPEEALGDHLI